MRRAPQRVKGTLWLAVVLLGAIMAGCAVQLGKPFDASQVTTLKVGATTQAEVLERLGPPASKGLKDGRPLWTYLYARVAMTGGAANGTVLSVEFDAAGVVRSYSYVPY